MPLTKKGKKILSSMRKTYGAKKTKQVFYASINKGRIKGAERTFKHGSGILTGNSVLKKVGAL